MPELAGPSVDKSVTDYFRSRKEGKAIWLGLKQVLFTFFFYFDITLVDTIALLSSAAESARPTHNHSEMEERGLVVVLVYRGSSLDPPLL